MNITTASNEALEFTREDCLAAISANPENTKCEEYLHLARACSHELGIRKFAEIDRLAQAALKRERDQDARAIKDRWLARFADFATAIQ